MELELDFIINIKDLDSKFISTLKSARYKSRIFNSLFLAKILNFDYSF